MTTALPAGAAAGDPPQRIHWTEFEQPTEALWRSEAGVPPPRRVRIADERLPADEAYRLVCEGTALLWRGDYHRAKDLLQAFARRIDGPPKGRRRGGPPERGPLTPTEAFHRERQARVRRARVLGMLLLPFEPGHQLALRRAPDAQEACEATWGPSDAPYVVSLREFLGLIGAHEWRKAGVEVPALGERIHAHYGVFSPVRGEYIALVAKAPLPAALRTAALAHGESARAFDIGTGTGVLAALLARRGVPQVVATDSSPRALACAAENLQRLGLQERVQVVAADLWPQGAAALVVCNPPWVPASAASLLEQAVYDPDSRMLRGFLAGLAAHLVPGGEGWLVLSDLAEHLGLRSREALQGWIDGAGLQVLGRIDTRPVHPRANDASDPLHRARAAEVTSLWRLGARPVDQG